METFASDATIINLELHQQQVKPLSLKNSLVFLEDAQQITTTITKTPKKESCIKRALLFTAIKCGPNDVGVVSICLTYIAFEEAST